MLRLTEIKLPLAHAENALQEAILHTLNITPDDLASLTVFKRSFDARKAMIMQVYIVDVEIADATLEAALLAQHAGHPHIFPTPDMQYHPVGSAPASLLLRPVVVGFGPCGMFAALVLAQMGFKPIVLERGKTVRERTKDTWGLWRKNVLNPESNVQFGEGGAGTFSDGKLYSQIKDPRHLGRKVMNEFVKAGAPADILFEAHPHIGTFKLVKVVENLREQIIALGGEIRFQQRVTDVLIEGEPGKKHIRGLTVLRPGHRPELRLARRPGRAGAGPQLARHLCHAARARRVRRGQAFFHRFSGRASAGPDRPRPLGPPCGRSVAGRGRIQAGAPRQQRPLGVQLLHVPRRHGGRRHVRSRAAS